jgi:hypothetical protein
MQGAEQPRLGGRPAAFLARLAPLRPPLALASRLLSLPLGRLSRLEGSVPAVSPLTAASLAAGAGLGWAGGVVVILGPTGRNVAAGMTGGLAYVLEETEGALDARLNKEIVQVQRVRTTAGEEQLRGLIEAHVEVSRSP